MALELELQERCRGEAAAESSGPQGLRGGAADPLAALAWLGEVLLLCFIALPVVLVCSILLALGHPSDRSDGRNSHE